jgi:hypothetical protein
MKEKKKEDRLSGKEEINGSGEGETEVKSKELKGVITWKEEYKRRCRR